MSSALALALLMASSACSDAQPLDSSRHLAHDDTQRADAGNDMRPSTLGEDTAAHGSNSEQSPTVPVALDAGASSEPSRSPPMASASEPPSAPAASLPTSVALDAGQTLAGDIGADPSSSSSRGLDAGTNPIVEPEGTSDAGVVDSPPSAGNTDASVQASDGVEPAVPSIPRPDEPGVWGASLPEHVTEATSTLSGCAGFEWLGGDIALRAISADGSTLIGNAGPHNGSGASGAGFRWRRGRAIEWLGETFAANDVSADGNWIAGTADDDTGYTPLLVGPSGEQQLLAVGGNAAAISADGSVVVGNTLQEDCSGCAFRWTADAGMEMLPAWGFNNDTPMHLGLQDVSADGTVVLGGGSAPLPDSSFSMWWTSQGGLESPDSLGFVRALSADGLVAIGNAGGPRGPSVAGAWQVPSGDPIELEFPRASEAWSNSDTTSVNADGSVVFGNAQEPNGEAEPLPARPAYVWQRDVGAQRVSDLLEAGCIDDLPLPDVDWAIVALSANARLIAGCVVLAGEGSCWLAALE